MKTSYYVIDAAANARVPANFRPANQFDFNATEMDNWQTSWSSEFIQQEDTEKYALEVSDSHDLLGLGAYKDTPEGFMVTVLYIESAPTVTPTLPARKNITELEPRYWLTASNYPESAATEERSSSKQKHLNSGRTISMTTELSPIAE